MSELMLMIVSIFGMMLIPVIFMIINSMIHQELEEMEKKKRVRLG